MRQYLGKSGRVKRSCDNEKQFRVSKSHQILGNVQNLSKLETVQYEYKRYKIWNSVSSCRPNILFGASTKTWDTRRDKTRTTV